MYRLVYLSHAKYRMSDRALDDILETSRRKNKIANITGMLLYARQTFFQVMEGPRDAIDATAERVFHDPRHHCMKVVSAQETNGRRFKEWAMGFQRLGDEDPRNEAFFTLTHHALQDRKPRGSSDQLMTYLQSFNECKVG